MGIYKYSNITRSYTKYVKYIQNWNIDILFLNNLSKYIFFLYIETQTMLLIYSLYIVYIPSLL